MADRRPASMLRGRHSECDVLDRLLEAVRAGRSGALAVRGEAGSGKTALLGYAIESASDLRIMRAVGVESGMELAFAGLHQLCVPMLGRLDGLPDPQRDALQTAFGLSPGALPDRFLVGLAVLSLLSAAAKERPLPAAAPGRQAARAARRWAGPGDLPRGTRRSTVRRPLRGRWQCRGSGPRRISCAAGGAAAAADALESLSQTTRPSGTDWALGVEARCRALLSRGKTAEHLYREAIERFGRSRVRIALARAYLRSGEWLRQEDRRLDAREQLRTAYEMCTRIGLEAFARRAERELQAAGGRVRKRVVPKISSRNELGRALQQEPTAALAV